MRPAGDQPKCAVIARKPGHSTVLGKPEVALDVAEDVPHGFAEESVAAAQDVRFSGLPVDPQDSVPDARDPDELTLLLDCVDACVKEERHRRETLLAIRPAIHASVGTTDPDFPVDLAHGRDHSAARRQRWGSP